MSILTSLFRFKGELTFSALPKEEQVIWGGEFSELGAFYGEVCNGWHEKRQREFLLGRYLIHLTLKEKKISFWNYPVEIGESRQPAFHPSMSGSLTHNQSYVVFAMKEGDYCIGIDVEKKKRIKKNIEKQILTQNDYICIENDMKKYGDTTSDMNTLIFSAKESCFKALYPMVDEYFGFHDAYFRNFDRELKTFEIEVIKNFKLPLKKPIILAGSYIEDSENILTSIEPRCKKSFLK